MKDAIIRLIILVMYTAVYVKAHEAAINKEPMGVILGGIAGGILAGFICVI